MTLIPTEIQLWYSKLVSSVSIGSRRVPLQIDTRAKSTWSLFRTTF